MGEFLGRYLGEFCGPTEWTLGRQTIGKTCPSRDSNPDLADFKSAASADWATGAPVQPIVSIRRGRTRRVRAWRDDDGRLPREAAAECVWFRRRNYWAGALAGSTGGAMVFGFGLAAATKDARGLSRFSSGVLSRPANSAESQSRPTRNLRSTVGIARPW